MKAGDIVEYKEKDYLAIKVNEKSAYICENRNFLNLWANRAKGITWKELCHREGAFKVSPDKLKLKEEGAVEVKKKQTRKNKAASNQAEKLLQESFERFKKREKGKKTKTPAFIIETGNERIVPIKANTEKGKILFHNTGLNTFHFYDVNTKEFSNFSKEKHKDNNDIIWP